MEPQEKKPNLIQAIFSLVWEVIKIILGSINAKGNYKAWRQNYEKKRLNRIQRASKLRSFDGVRKEDQP